MLSQLSALLLAITVTAIIFEKNTPISVDIKSDKTNTISSQKNRPNILIFSSDGVNSEHMTIYGSERDTTPFMASIASETTIYLNHLTNSSKTTGSVGALLSGKHPTRTRVLFRPDTFSGQHMFQHFPAILKSMGYYNSDISLRHYVDPQDLKLRNGFDYANSRKIDSSPHWFNILLLEYWPNTYLFIEETSQRFYQRVFHLTGLNNFTNPHRLVTQKVEGQSVTLDRERMNQLVGIINSSPRPFFAHVHLLGTHGERFDYEKPIFTKTKHQPEPWMNDHYDNAIYQWDQYVKEVYLLLKKRGELENTILVFNSDHGLDRTINKTLPLVIRFPNQKHTGYVSQPSQRLDIAPTLLSYLGVPSPDWMDGSSLLSRDNESYPIFIVRSLEQQQFSSGNWVVAANIEPPFYSLGTISVAYCGELYSLDVNNIESISMKNQTIHAKTNACPTGGINQELAYNLLRDHLNNMGYDTSLLPLNSDFIIDVNSTTHVLSAE
ncbi:sulfatase-like hydrolase/transferase [Vibrio kyushuensis]|uniref:sulfatase-like hydrolase/transferase n=1 Tax=Vibrio kyushuensis TaxID=2910249 RepID=UPI003D0B64F3